MDPCGNFQSNKHADTLPTLKFVNQTRQNYYVGGMRVCMFARVCVYCNVDSGSYRAISAYLVVFRCSFFFLLNEKNSDNKKRHKLFVGRLVAVVLATDTYERHKTLTINGFPIL